MSTRKVTSKWSFVYTFVSIQNSYKNERGGCALKVLQKQRAGSVRKYKKFDQIFGTTCDHLYGSKCWTMCEKFGGDIMHYAAFGMSLGSYERSQKSAFSGNATHIKEAIAGRQKLDKPVLDERFQCLGILINGVIDWSRAERAPIFCNYLLISEHLEPDWFAKVYYQEESNVPRKTLSINNLPMRKKG